MTTKLTIEIYDIDDALDRGDLEEFLRRQLNYVVNKVSDGYRGETIPKTEIYEHWYDAGFYEITEDEDDGESDSHPRPYCCPSSIP